MRKNPLLAVDELERALDLRAKLLGRLQLAAADEGKRHASAGEAIGKLENVGRHSHGLRNVSFEEGDFRNEINCAYCYAACCCCLLLLLLPPPPPPPPPLLADVCSLGHFLLQPELDHPSDSPEMLEPFLC